MDKLQIIMCVSIEFNLYSASFIFDLLLSRKWPYHKVIVKLLSQPSINTPK